MFKELPHWGRRSAVECLTSTHRALVSPAQYKTGVPGWRNGLHCVMILQSS